MANQVTPAFAVPSGTPIQVSVSCDGIVSFDILVSQLMNGKWVAQPPLTPPPGAIVHGTPATFNLPPLSQGQTDLLTIPFVETSVASGDTVSTVITIVAGGQVQGKVRTPPVAPSDSQAAQDTLFIELEA
jgi:hypothetical protein